ncbi:MAG: class I SAM-dependent methyltransferase [Phycisphaerae bacterium]|nr:class I SAM-dependent methyltransferase [Phycisphaerae bacterium]
MTEPLLNKTMDRADLGRPDCRDVLEELFDLMRRLRRRAAAYSSWYGRLHAWPSPWEFVNRGADYQPLAANPDELAIPWFLLWEIAWTVANTPLVPGSTVLDMGGAGSLFACYLAARGHEVVAIDINPELVRQTDRIGRTMNWRLYGRCMDMQALDFPAACFQHVFSLCVYEHLPVSGRVRCGAELARILHPGGTAALTFDYNNPQAFAGIDSPQDVEAQLVVPTGLNWRGRPGFFDNGLRYLDAPPYFGFGRLSAFASRFSARLRGTIAPGRFSDRCRRYTFGAVFLKKPDARVGI